jgi:hypothetical protein
MAMKRVCYEVKTSSGDFLSELKHPIERRIGMRYSNEFYFVTTAALVSVGEIPPECGLVVTATINWPQLNHKLAGRARAISPCFH